MPRYPILGVTPIIFSGKGKGLPLIILFEELVNDLTVFSTFSCRHEELMTMSASVFVKIFDKALKQSTEKH